MGVWGAAQGIAFGAGGFLGTLAVDLARLVTAEPVYAYAAVFAGEALLFLVALAISLGVEHATVGRRKNPLTETASFQLSPGFDAR